MEYIYKKIENISIGDFYVQAQYELDLECIPLKKRFVRHKLMEIIGINVEKKEVLVYDPENDINWVKKAEPDFKGGYVFPIKNK